MRALFWILLIVAFTLLLLAGTAHFLVDFSDVETAPWIETIALTTGAAITAILAAAAFRSIWTSHVLSEKRRVEDRTKEDRDRLERQLKQIVDWATDACASAFEGGIIDPDNLDKHGAKSYMDAQGEVLGGLRIVRGKSLYTSRLSEHIDLGLNSRVDSTIKHLSRQIELVFSYIRKPSDSPIEEAIKLADNSEKLYDSATKLIDRATELLPGHMD